MYNIPGSATSPTSAAAPAADASPAAAGEGVKLARTVAEVMAQSQAGDVLDELDRELVGLAPVKARIRDIAALLVIDRLRMNQGLQAQTPSLHMSFTGQPGHRQDHRRTAHGADPSPARVHPQRAPRGGDPR